jgi:adenine-specific DNA-methyltransferase
MGRPGKKAQRLGLCVGSLFDDETVQETEQKQSLPGEFDSENPEDSYKKLVPTSHRKRYGQFFTPEPIAQLMVEWIAKVTPKAVLDPAVGPGIFLRLTRKQCSNAKLVGVELDSTAFSAAKLALTGDRVELVHHDFLTWQSDGTYDGVLANPPYLRHHDINYSSDIYAEIGRRSGVVLSKLSNIYVLFVLEICRRLRPGGRAAVIVPGEWTNANFGMALKQFLLSHGYLHGLVYFSNLSEQFEDALTTASILLLEKSTVGEGRREFIDSYFVERGAETDHLRRAIFDGARDSAGIVYRRFESQEVIGLDKWDKVLKDGAPVHVPGFVRVSGLATTRRGIATGANEFFHVTDSAVETHQLQRRNLKSCVGRADDVKGLIFTSKDFAEVRGKSSRAWLLSFEAVPDAAEQRYLDSGIATGLNKRFLLAGRRPWYSMERRAPAPIWAAVFGRKSLRFVYNEAEVSNLTTFHCVYPTRTDALYCRALVACLNSRVVQGLAEHQRRVYGAGLMKFEPKDLLAILVPNIDRAPHNLLVELSNLLGELDASVRARVAASDDLVSRLDSLVQQVAKAIA